MLRLVLSDETEELLVVERKVVHPRNKILDILEIVAELIDNLVDKNVQLSNREQRKLGHIRNSTRRNHNKR